MFEKIRICLTKPRFIGMLLLEKTYKVVILTILSFLILLSSCFISNYGTDYIGASSKIQLYTALSSTDFTVSNSTLSITTPKDVSINNDGEIVAYHFLTTNKNDLATINIYFNKDNIVFEIPTIGINLTTKYAIDFNIKTSTYDSFAIFINNSLKPYNTSLYVYYSLYQFSYLIFDYFTSFLTLFIISSLFNKVVSAKYKVKLLFYSSFLTYIFLFISVLSSSVLIYNLAYIILMFYYYIALQNIINIKEIG